MRTWRTYISASCQLLQAFDCYRDDRQKFQLGVEESQQRCDGKQGAKFALQDATDFYDRPCDGCSTVNAESNAISRLTGRPRA